MITFYAIFLILCLSASLFCVGWYNITRGWVEYLPDGTKKNVGQVFGFWQRFWEEQLDTQRIYYNNEATERKYFELNYLDPKLAYKLYVDKEYNIYCISKKEGVEILDTELLKIENLLGCKIQKNLDHNFYHLYIENPIFRFPEIIRKPISACIRCYASVYGTLIWALFCLLNYNVFYSFSNKNIAILTFWFIFIVILSALNPYFNKKLNN